MPDTIDGQCLCGSVTITLTKPKHELEICQCEMCRRWTGSFYAALEFDDFALSGEEHVTAFSSSDWGERAFCKTCGSSLWWRFKPTDNRSFSAGLFDATRTAEIEKEIFVDERADWCRLSGEHPQKTGAEVIAEAKAAGFSFD